MTTEPTLVPTRVTLSFPARPAMPAGLDLQAIAPNVRGVAVRVSRIRVLDTHKAWFLGRDVADVYPVFLLVAGPAKEPATMTTLKVYNDVPPGGEVAIASTAPPTVFRSLDRLPSYMDLHILLMRSHQRTRDVGAAITSVMGSPEGKAIIATIETLVTGANPAVGAAITAGQQLLTLVGKLLSDHEDRQLFYTVASFERTDDLGMGLTHTFRDANAEVDVRVEGVPYAEVPATEGGG